MFRINTEKAVLQKNESLLSWKGKTQEKYLNKHIYREESYL